MSCTQRPSDDQRLGICGGEFPGKKGKGDGGLESLDLNRGVPGRAERGLHGPGRARQRLGEAASGREKEDRGPISRRDKTEPGRAGPDRTEPGRAFDIAVVVESATRMGVRWRRCGAAPGSARAVSCRAGPWQCGPGRVTAGQAGPGHDRPDRAGSQVGYADDVELQDVGLGALRRTHTHTHSRTHTHNAHAHVRTRTHTHTHARTHTRTHSHTHILPIESTRQPTSSDEIASRFKAVFLILD